MRFSWHVCFYVSFRLYSTQDSVYVYIVKDWPLCLVIITQLCFVFSLWWELLRCTLCNFQNIQYGTNSNHHAVYYILETLFYTWKFIKWIIFTTFAPAPNPISSNYQSLYLWVQFLWLVLCSFILSFTTNTNKKIAGFVFKYCSNLENNLLNIVFPSWTHIASALYACWELLIFTKKAKFSSNLG